MGEIEQCMTQGGPEAVSRLEIDQGVQCAGEKSQADHQRALTKSGAPVVEMPEGKPDVSHDHRRRPSVFFSQAIDEKSDEDKNLQLLFVITEYKFCATTLETHEKGDASSIT